MFTPDDMSSQRSEIVAYGEAIRGFFEEILGNKFNLQNLKVIITPVPLLEALDSSETLEKQFDDVDRWYFQIDALIDDGPFFSPCVVVPKEQSIEGLGTDIRTLLDNEDTLEAIRWNLAYLRES